MYLKMCSQSPTLGIENFARHLGEDVEVARFLNELCICMRVEAIYNITSDALGRVCTLMLVA